MISAGPYNENNGLVFGLDTNFGVFNNNVETRQFKGKPTINYAPSDLANWGTEGSAQRIPTGNKYYGQPTYDCRTEVGAVWRGIFTTVAGLRTSAGTGGTVTVSCMIRNTKAVNYSISAYIGHDFSGTRSVLASTDWQRIQWTVNQANMVSDHVEFRPNTNNPNTYLEMTMPQVEVNQPYATSFTPGTRSSTNSLLDLAGITDIDVTNISFDSNGNPLFDGANDRIAITDASKFYSNVWTWEFITKFNSNSGTYQGLVWGEGATGGGSGYQYLLTLYNYTYFHYRVYNTATQWTNTNVNIDFTPTEYNHIVWQFDNGNTKIYTNGELLHTDTSRGAYSGGETSPLYIGSRNDLAYDFNGSLPVAKHYNRILTDKEIQLNYKMYKTRFQL